MKNIKRVAHCLETHDFEQLYVEVLAGGVTMIAQYTPTDTFLDVAFTILKLTQMPFTYTPDFNLNILNNKRV
uniref:Uncharacterized protein n=1 Tax=Anopheles christyi TaxID=43041 RepID=A0A182K213_9DIPT